MVQQSERSQKPQQSQQSAPLKKVVSKTNSLFSEGFSAGVSFEEQFSQAKKIKRVGYRKSGGHYVPVTSEYEFDSGEDFLSSFKQFVLNELKEKDPEDPIALRFDALDLAFMYQKNGNVVSIEIASNRSFSQLQTYFYDIRSFLSAIFEPYSVDLVIKRQSD